MAVFFVLDATNKSITAELSAAPATTNPDFISTWADITTTSVTQGASDGVLNDVTPVTIVAAPAASTQRVVQNFEIANIDTAPVTVTLKYLNGASTRKLGSWTLAVGDKLRADGVHDSNGSLKTVFSSSLYLLLAGGTMTGTLKTAKSATTLTNTNIAAGVLTLPTDGNAFASTATSTVTSVATMGAGTIVILDIQATQAWTAGANLIFTGAGVPSGQNLNLVSGDVIVLYERSAGVWELIAHNKGLIGDVSATANTTSYTTTCTNINQWYDSTATVSFTPKFTGQYKISFRMPFINATNNARLSYARINSSGGTMVFQPTVINFTQSTWESGIVEAVYTLTAGTAYTFTVQNLVDTTAGDSVEMRNGANPTVASFGWLIYRIG